MRNHVVQYAFYFDSSACSGCKACQAACKDKHNLPVGLLWRRVYEVNGGEWQEVETGSPNPVWESTVFAYNLSVSCNHCAYPKCAGVCPADAYELREDGIVFLDTAKCAGCGYCAWACPYGAPQYDPDAAASRNDCGPACLAMILNAFGLPVTTDAVFQRTGAAPTATCP